MQTTETDKNHKLQSDEEAINFRPSPNFKHMKKYLKSKFEEANNTSMLNGSDDPNGPYNDSQEEITSVSNGEIQPPLPPNPPPPDSPLNITLKQEVEDDEYIEINNSPSEMSSDANKSEELIEDVKSHHPEKGNSKEIMCRNFIRGTCIKGASCIFAHKVILSQLDKVYKFCNDFQNTGCKRRNCNFVHATVFEKESFLRTAYLPPHTLSHLNKRPSIQPLLTPSEVTIASVPSKTVGAPPPNVILGSVTPLPIMSCASAVDINSRITHGDVFRAETAKDTTLKREWADIDNLSGSSDDIENIVPPAKKCKNCDIDELRLQVLKTNSKTLRRSNTDLDQKIAAINSKGQRLLTVLSTVIKSASPKSKLAGTSNAFPNITEEKEQVVKEQVAMLSSMPTFCEENSKSVNGNLSFQSYLAKMLMRSMDPLLLPDGS